MSKQLSSPGPTRAVEVRGTPRCWAPRPGKLVRTQHVALVAQEMAVTGAGPSGAGFHPECPLLGN